MNQYCTSQHRNTCVLGLYDRPQDKDRYEGLSFLY